MSTVNKRIMETIQESSFPKEIKELLRVLLNIELRNFQNRNPLYSKEYDRIIMEFVETRRRREDNRWT